MKNIIRLFLILALSLSAFEGIAQNNVKIEAYTKDTTVHNYALLVRTEDHIRAAIKTAETLRKSKNSKAGNIEIVVCGEAVELLQQNSTLKNVLENGKAVKTSIVACGMSLEKQKIDRGSLLPGIRVEDNGLIRIFELQAAGYLTIEL
jgi:intracellular sulfur oxidation DsrE/DsrF family protein